MWWGTSRQGILKRKQMMTRTKKGVDELATLYIKRIKIRPMSAFPVNSRDRLHEVL